MSGIADLGAQSAQESQSSTDSDNDYSEYERFDLNGSSFGRQHPTTAVRGEAVALRRLYDENDPDRADVAVVLDEPDIVTDEPALDGSVVVTSDEEGDQFKVVNLDDDDTKQPSDEMIDFDGNTYYGQVGDDFGDIDRIALKRGGSAGRSITSVLDVNGATPAYAQVERNEDGELVDIELGDDGFPAHNGGLVEYDNRNIDETEIPRYARNPELRDDVEGNDVVIMIQRLSEVDPDYNGRAYWATVFASLEDDRMDELAEQYADDADGKSAEDFKTELDGETFIKLKPTDEFEPDEALLDDTGWISWNGIDRENADEVLMLNEMRLDDDHSAIYVPEGLDVDEVTPDSVDEVETDPGEDDWDDESLIKAFGGGV